MMGMIEERSYKDKRNVLENDDKIVTKLFSLACILNDYEHTLEGLLD